MEIGQNKNYGELAGSIGTFIFSGFSKSNDFNDY